MNSFKVMVFAVLALLICLPLKAASEKTTSDGFVAGTIAQNAPPELRHLSSMIGQWSTQEESLKQDGSGWQPSKGADWDFFWAFDGWGVQDNYTSPPKSEKLDDESKRQRGINLRIYNLDEKKWVLTWLTPKSKKPQNFTAVSSEKGMVMSSDSPDANGYHRRITFFDITEQSFEWKLEWSKDQQQWLEVYRIHGTRK